MAAIKAIKADSKVVTQTKKFEQAHQAFLTAVKGLETRNEATTKLFARLSVEKKRLLTKIAESLSSPNIQQQVAISLVKKDYEQKFAAAKTIWDKLPTQTSSVSTP